MASWARYTGAIYFGLMMSGAMAPPDWSLASAPTAIDSGLGDVKPSAYKPPAQARGKNLPGLDPAAHRADRPTGRPPAWASEFDPHAPRHGPQTRPAPPLPGGPDLLR